MDRLPVPQRLLAGISGGADSVALLHLLCRQGADVTAVHVNHGLRGADSDGDEAFVRQLCASWQVPLLVYRAEPPAHPGEDWARRARYGFFRQAADETGLTTIALAHHQDDQAETLLLHLLRGAGLTGLQGMAAQTQAEGLCILRPLLAHSRQALRQLLTDAGISWREDGSNADPRYLRNALRSGVMPQLEALIPGAGERIARMATLLQDDEAVLQDLTQRFLARHGGDDFLLLEPLREQPRALQRRILREWWLQRAGENLPEHTLSAAQTEALTALINAPTATKCNLPAGCTGYKGWTHLHLTGLPKHTMTDEQPLEQSGLIRLEPAAGRTGDGKTCQTFPAWLLQGLTLRTRRSGDWIRPFGSSGRQSLQDYLVNKHVDAPFRDRVPLVCRGSEVLLAGGVGAGNLPAASEEEGVMLCWTIGFSWHRG